MPARRKDAKKSKAIRWNPAKMVRNFLQCWCKPVLVLPFSTVTMGGQSLGKGSLSH